MPTVSKLPPTGILHIEEHLHCGYYDLNGKTVQIITAGKDFQEVEPDTVILFILSGTMSFSYGTTSDYTISEGDFMLFPPGIEVSVKIKNPVKYFALKIHDHVALCSQYALGKLYKEQNCAIEHTHLTSNRKIKTFIEEWTEIIEHGVQCLRFISLKTQELFFLLRFYYPEDELARFYLPLLGADGLFVNTIWKNYRKVRNTIELANLTNQSLSRLQKEFKRIVGISIGEWLIQRKIQNVHYDLSQGEKSLKEIASEYHFSSPSHLGVFCKKYYGKPPAVLRHENEVAK
jgi:AraC-like DNA-binding protein